MSWEPQGRAGSAQVIKAALVVFVPTMAFLFAVALLAMLLRTGTQRDAFRQAQRRLVELPIGLVQEQLRSVSTALVCLACQAEEENVFTVDNGVDDAALAHFGEILMGFAEFHEQYRQIRLLDDQGEELLRINRRDDALVLAAPADLQNKQHRPCFEQTYKLSRGQMYASPLGLNVEHGEVQFPYEPILRLGVPVFDADGSKSGIFIFDYSGEHILAHFSVVQPTEGAQILLLNSDGYYLHSPAPDVRWGFMLDDRRRLTFESTHPRAWDYIRAADHGKIETDHGLFTFSTAYPLLDDPVTCAGAGTATNSTATYANAENYTWKIISHVPTDVLYQQRKALLPWMRWGLAILALPVGIGSWLLGRARVERNRGHQAIKEAEARFRVLVENAPEAIVVLDVDLARFVEANDNAVRLFKLPREKLLESGPADLSPPTQPDGQASDKASSESIRAALDGERPVFEWMHRDAQGNNIPCEVCLVLLPSTDRRLIRGSITDITGRLRATNELEDSEALYRRLVESIKVISWEMNLESFQFTFVGGQAERILGYSVEDWLVEGFWQDHVHADDAEKALAFCMAKTKLLQDHELEYRMIARDGRIIWIYDLVSVVVDEDRKPRQLRGAMVDISERKEVEEELRRSRESLALAQRFARIGSWERNLQTDVATWSDETFRLFGLDPQAGAPSFEAFLEHFHPDDRAMVRERIDDALSGRKIYSLDARMTRVDGTEWYMHSEGEVERNDGGTPVIFRGTVQDITERKRAEQQKEQLEARLLHAQKLEAIGQLASGVTHDINNLLLVISASTDLVRPHVSNAAALSALKTMAEAVDQATGVTRSLLTFSHDKPLEKKPVNLSALVESALPLLRRSLPATVEITLDIAIEPHPWIMADPTQLHQVLMNLAVNARDAMPDGGLLSITVSPPSEETGPPPGRSTLGMVTQLSVSDTGTGMEQEVKDRALEPFFTTKTRGQGTGLGLSIVHGIVENHYGWMTIDTKPGVGATFIIHLPCTPPPLLSIESHAVPAAAGGHGELILLVEDDIQVAAIMRSSLESRGYKVMCSSDGASFLDLFDRQRASVRLLILDVGLPKRRGQDCLAAIRADAFEGPALLITGAIDGDLDTPVDDHTTLLRKPFSMLELAHVTRRLIDKSEQHPST